MSLKSCKRVVHLEPQEVALADLTIPEGYTLEQIAQTVGQLQGDFKEPLGVCYSGSILG